MYNPPSNPNINNTIQIAIISLRITNDTYR